MTDIVFDPAVDPAVDPELAHEDASMAHATADKHIPDPPVHAARVAALEHARPVTNRTHDANTLDHLESAGDGSVFTKVKNGWRIDFVMPGGSHKFLTGTSIPDAFATDGLQRTHDSHGNEHGKAPTSGVQ